MSLPNGGPSAPHPAFAVDDDSWQRDLADLEREFNTFASSNTLGCNPKLDEEMMNFGLNVSSTEFPAGVPQTQLFFQEDPSLKPAVSNYTNLDFNLPDVLNNLSVAPAPVASTSTLAPAPTTEEAQAWEDWKKAYSALKAENLLKHVQAHQVPTPARIPKIRPDFNSFMAKAASPSFGQRTGANLSEPGFEFAFKLGPLQKGVKNPVQMNWTGDDSNVLGSELKIWVVNPKEVEEPFKVEDINQPELIVRECKYAASLHVVFTSLPAQIFGPDSPTWQQDYVAKFFVDEHDPDAPNLPPHRRRAYCYDEVVAKAKLYPHRLEYGYSLHQGNKKQAWGQHSGKAPYRLKPLILQKLGSTTVQHRHVCTLVVEIHDRQGNIVKYGDGLECRAESNRFRFLCRDHQEPTSYKKRRFESTDLESEQQVAYDEIYEDQLLGQARPPQPTSMTSQPFGDPAPRPTKPPLDPRPDIPPITWTPLNRYSKKRHSKHWTDRIALISQYLAHKHAARIKQNAYETRPLRREDFPLLMKASIEHHQDMAFEDGEEMEQNSVLRNRDSMGLPIPRKLYTYDFASVERRIHAILDLIESWQDPLPYLVDTCVNFTLHTVLFREETVAVSEAVARPVVKLSVHTLGEEGAILRRVDPLYALAWLVVSSSTHSEHVSDFVIRPYQEIMLAERIRFDKSDIERFRWILHLVHLDQLLHWLSDNRQSYLSAFASRVLDQEIELANTSHGANMPRSMNLEEGLSSKTVVDPLQT